MKVDDSMQFVLSITKSWLLGLPECRADICVLFIIEVLESTKVAFKTFLCVVTVEVKKDLA